MLQHLDHRITPQHRERAAVVYVRQSDPAQVRKHTESTRLQLGLREKAVSLGWPCPVAIEDDLGISAAGFADRPGFQRLLADVATRKVGIILCFDATRLSRNSKDWAHLFELCGHFNTLVADLDQIYDLSIPNDKLVLGIKGTVAELELSIIRTRTRVALEAKAARGELKFIVPPGYTHDHAGLIITDPDRRVRDAISFMFNHFDRSTSIRQLSLWYRDTKTLFPVRKVRDSCPIAWEIPTHSTLRKLLEHPIYAGVYAYGRRTSRVEYVDGRLVKRVGGIVPLDECRVCIKDHHDAYIDLERYHANQAKIADARPRWSMNENRGAVRDGLALLAGLLRCGHCGRRLHVAYKNKSALYYCDGGTPKDTNRCLAFGSKLIDRAVARDLCRALEPLAIQAAEAAFDRRRLEQTQAIEHAELQVQAAQYEADRAFEQFDLADPKNRLVVDTLEQRLNQYLADLLVAQRHLQAAAAAHQPLTDEQRDQIQWLAHHFSAAWDHQNTPGTLRKRLIRTAIHEIIVVHKTDIQRLEVTIHWQGGAHTRLQVNKRATPVGSKTDPSLVHTVRELAASLGDAEIARILNMKRTTTPMDLRWTQDRVLGFRRTHRIRLLGRRTPDPDILTAQQAAHYLGISRNGLTTLVRIGAVHKDQVTDFAPWRISRAELDSQHVQSLVRALKTTGRVPRERGCPDQQTPLFPALSNPKQGDPS